MVSIAGLMVRILLYKVCHPHTTDGSAFNFPLHPKALLCMTVTRSRRCLFVIRLFLAAQVFNKRPPTSLIARFMGPTWGTSGADRTQVGPCWPHVSPMNFAIWEGLIWPIYPYILGNIFNKKTPSLKLVAQIPRCASPISHNAPFCNRNVHMCAHFCY